MGMMIERKKRLMMQNKNILNTSPVILEYDRFYQANGSIGFAEGYCITDKYFYPTMSATGAIAFYGIGTTPNRPCLIYKDNGETKIDYWSLNDGQSPRKCINVGSDAIAVTLKTDMLNDCYMYIVETGQILFAGRNSIYYGHRNISELN